MQKKFLIIAGIVIVVLGLGVVFFWISSRAPGAPGENTFKSSVITFTKPTGATAKSAPISGGGSGVVINLSGASSSFDIIEIQIIPNTQVSLQNIYAIMKGFGLSQSSITVGPGQIPAARFQGAMGLGGNSLQQDVVVFEKNGNVYKFQMMYHGKDVNPNFESQFNQVLSTTNI